TGSVPHVVPNVLPDFAGRRPGGAAGWADSAVIIPWTMYLSYGDRRILERQYDSMAKWVAYEKGRAGDDLIWDGDFHFGDWLAYAAPPEEARAYPGATTGTDLLATAFFAHSADLLARYGYLDEAYMLLNREEYPSWLYPVKQGATTIWERWDGQKPDGTFQDVGMNSFNHYAYGAVGDWMYRVMAGIEIDESAPG